MLEIKRLIYIFSFFTFYFMSKDCNAQKINLFDGNNKRTGTWKKYHSNKKIRYTGQFKDGKEFGVFKFYDITTSRKPNKLLLLVIIPSGINLSILSSNFESETNTSCKS